MLAFCAGSPKDRVVCTCLGITVVYFFICLIVGFAEVGILACHLLILLTFSLLTPVGLNRMDAKLEMGLLITC